MSLLFEGIEELDGEQLKKAILSTCIPEDRYPYTRQEFKKYTVVQTSDPRSIAKVDSQNKIVFFNLQLLKELGWDKPEIITFLVYHEMSHSMLGHHERTVIQIAKYLGYIDENSNDTTLTKEQFEDVMQHYARPNFLFRKYNMHKGIHTSNGAGDIHLSIGYFLQDVEAMRVLHGLYYKDFDPAWETEEFEEINNHLLDREKELKKRCLPITCGHFDADGEFVEEYTIEPEIAKTTEINPIDIYDVQIPSLSMMKEAQGKSSGTDITSWSYDNSDIERQDFSGEYAPVCNIHGLLRQELKSKDYPVIPLLKVENLDLYDAINKNDGKCTCFGKPAVVVDFDNYDTSSVVFLDSPFKSIFDNDDSVSQFRRTDLSYRLHDWLNEQLAKEQKDEDQ